MENKEILRKLRSVEICMTAHPDNEKSSEFEDRIVDLQEVQQALTLTDVVKSSDLWVVEFSDNEIKLMTSKELQDYENECMNFDGFMGCIVLGRLAKSK